MTPTSSLRLAATMALATLALTGCSTITGLLEPEPLSRTTSIVNGTQVTRGPARGSIPSGFATTNPPPATSFEPSVGEPFDIEELARLPEADAALPELQGIDFAVEEARVTDIVSSGSVAQSQNAAADFAQIGQSVYFATDSSDLNERARETLRQQAAWLNVNPQARVIIEGHADERGTREYNLALGDRRASATRGYLIAVGVDDSRIDKVSYGKERPVALGSNEQAWAQNRRTETIIQDNGNALSDFAPLSQPAANLGDVTTTALESPFPMPEPLISGTSDSLILNPIYPQEGSTALIPLPNSTNWESSSGLYAPPVSGADAPRSVTYNSGTIAPTVFDTVAPAAAPVMVETAPAPVYLDPIAPVSAAPAPMQIAPVQAAPMQPAPSTTTSATRIEDVSVDDLLRDPSLIDRLGSPAATSRN